MSFSALKELPDFSRVASGFAVSAAASARTVRTSRRLLRSLALTDLNFTTASFRLGPSQPALLLRKPGPALSRIAPAGRGYRARTAVGALQVHSVGTNGYADQRQRR